MNEKIDTVEYVAEQVIEKVQRDLPGVQRLDKGLADKLKKMGDAATEVVKHVQERRGPATG
jgi:hypothetical protein